jgi:hypothetical protein
MSFYCVRCRMSYDNPDEHRHEPEDRMTETTPEQRAAVRRDECRAHGHSFTEVATYGLLAPQSVVCTNCGAMWRIHPDDVHANFGSTEEGQQQ